MSGEARCTGKVNALVCGEIDKKVALSDLARDPSVFGLFPPAVLCRHAAVLSPHTLLLLHKHRRPDHRRQPVMVSGLFKSAVRGARSPAPRPSHWLLAALIDRITSRPPHPPARRRPVLPTYHPFLFHVQYFRFYGTRKNATKVVVCCLRS